MSKLFSKRAIILTLAVAMTAGLFAVSANAEAPGFAPGVNAQFWYSNTDLNAEFQQRLQIGGVTVTPPLGRNTIQEYIHINTGSSNNFYAITTHPQYFGTTTNYDDQVTAKYVLEITGLYVWNEDTNGYVDCFGTGFGIIPASYAVELPTAADPGYFQCEVFAQIMNLDTGEVFNADWNGATAYLEIPAGL